jgi:hypothetical protein
VDLAALERGLQEFLDRLDRITPAAAWDADDLGLIAWVIAAAAALTACEIGRRQLRRAAGEQVPPPELPPGNKS